MILTKTPASVRSAENQFAYPGWRIAAVCHIGVLTGFATVFIYSFSFMVKPLGQALGWDREQIARAFSLAAISVAIFSPFIGGFLRSRPKRSPVHVRT
jgi:sugar phosphate permease